MEKETCTVRAPPLWVTSDWRRHLVVLVSPPCGVSGIDVSGVDLTLDDERLLREFESGWSESS
jgi:hypothetical protein